ARTAVPLGKTKRGELSLRFDARLGQAIVVESRPAPLDSAGRAALAKLAALGGPLVQRVLRLEDEQVIVYEALGARPTSTPWDVQPFAALSSDARVALLDAARTVAAGSAVPLDEIPVVSTATGPVILLVVTTDGEAYS
ncbi:MAG TPA: hypothetical protein VGF45_08665, partial [Polyangia bacterium]